MVPKLWLLDWNSFFEVQKGAGFDMEANCERVFGIGKNGRAVFKRLARNL